MTDKTTKDITVDLGIFPLPVVESALYTLGDRIDGRIGEVKNNRVSITVEAREEGLAASAMERAFSRALIATSVNQRAFQSAASIRNYLAQTALSITTESQQTIEEFAASLGSGGADEHSGAPVGHVDVSLPEDQANSATGVQLTVDQENRRVLLQLDGRKYLLPDALWAAHQMRDTCTCSIDNMQPGGQLSVLLEPDDEEADLNVSGERFAHWLDVAVERSL